MPRARKSLWTLSFTMGDESSVIPSLRLYSSVEGIANPMARRYCAWCNRFLGLGPGPDEDTHGICNTCELRLECEGALDHALMALRAATEEVERVRANMWP